MRKGREREEEKGFGILHNSRSGKRKNRFRNK